MLAQMQTRRFCGPDRVHPGDDPGETTEHAYATCPGLDDLWTWAAATLLLPTGGQHSKLNATAAIQNPDNTRRALVGCVSQGPLGVIELDDKHNVLAHTEPPPCRPRMP